MGVLDLTVAKILLDTPLTPAGVTVEDDGMRFLNTGRVYLHILGGGAGALAITINSVGVCSQGADHDIILTPVAATIYLVGPFPKGRFDDGDGYVNITLEGGAEADVMKVQAIELV